MSMTPDAVHTLASKLEREWPHGARFESITPGPTWGSAVGECRSSDGGTWFVACDRWGNAFTYADTRTEVEGNLLLTVAFD